MISVVIPSYRNPTYLDLCLKSATEGQDHDNQIIVVLDGFGEESQDVVTAYPGIDVLEFPENRGQMVAHNMGVTLAEHEDVLIVNDDNVFPRHWDTKLSVGFPENYVIAPNQIEPRPSMFDSFDITDFGITPDEFQLDAFLEYEDRNSRFFKEQMIDFNPDGQTWPLFMKKKWYMALGGIDQNYPSAAVADWDFFLRCELAGLECHRYYPCQFYHFAGAATRKVDAQWNSKEAASFEYFKFKWGYTPHLNKYNHSKRPKGTVRGINFNV